jgi:McbB family protein
VRKLTYKIIPFLITNYDDKSVVQNSENLVILKDKNMIDFLNWCDENAVYEVKREQVENFLKDRTSDGIKFMIDNNLIYLIKGKPVDYKDIVIYSNDDVFLDSMKFNAKGYDRKFLYKKLAVDNTNVGNLKKGNLYIIFLNPFNFRYFSEVVGSFREQNILCRFAFYYNNKIYITNYYKREWYNPCPLCFFGNLEASLRGMSAAYNTVSFQTLLDLIYKKDAKFQVKNNFSNYDMMLLTETLLYSLEIKNMSNINNVYYVDIKDHSVYSDSAMYWELCDCYD